MQKQPCPEESIASERQSSPDRPSALAISDPFMIADNHASNVFTRLPKKTVVLVPFQVGEAWPA